MARPLQDGSRAEPAAAVPGSPAFALGGTVALPPPGCRTPLVLPPGLNCALCPGGPPPSRALYRCMRGPEPPRSRSSQAHHGGPWAVESSPPTQEAPAEAAAAQQAAQPNGHLPGSTAPSLEQALGARLRHMGDEFHREHQGRRQQQRWRWRQQQPPAWDPFYRFISQLLGIFYNLPVEGGEGLGPN